MTDPDSSGGSEAIEEVSEIPEYHPPRRGVPDPSEAPLDPYDGRKLDRQLSQYPTVGLERDLKMVAQNIRSSKTQLESHLRQTRHSTGGDLLDIAINPNQEMVRNPTGFPASRRAKTAQSNLRTHRQRWGELCERYFRLVRDKIDDADA